LSRPQIKDAIVYSSTGHLVGLRIRFEPTQLAPGLPLPIVVWCGLAHQFIALNDLGGGDYAGAQGVDQAAAADSWEIGALLHFGITPRAALRFELRRLYMFGDAIAGLSRRNRQSYSLGLEFTIGSNREK
jgi:hypothetical protein